MSTGLCTLGETKIICTLSGGQEFPHRAVNGRGQTFYNVLRNGQEEDDESKASRLCTGADGSKIIVALHLLLIVYKD